ncbi:hypothetical protein SAMN04487901_11961 [Prevotella communis]|uniref:Uncharacterized protein n=1 Tax=Prevotella communis TaxID=2913614 RepID=A0A1G8AHD2_9BACT|nr:hypothetical protein SAMN04487901_11961 [Prevotella communis]
MDFDGFRMEDWKICIHGFFPFIFPYQTIFFFKMETDCIFFTIFAPHKH